MQRLEGWRQGVAIGAKPVGSGSPMSTDESLISSGMAGYLFIHLYTYSSIGMKVLVFDVFS